MRLRGGFINYLHQYSHAFSLGDLWSFSAEFPSEIYNIGVKNLILISGLIVKFVINDEIQERYK